MHIWTSGCQALKMSMILAENQVTKRTIMLWQLFAKVCTKGKKILVLDQVNVQCDVVICPTEKRYSHPNEMREDFEIIGHVPKLMAIWLTKFLKRAANSGKAVIKGKRVNRGGVYGLEMPFQSVG